MSQLPRRPKWKHCVNPSIRGPFVQHSETLAQKPANGMAQETQTSLKIRV